MDDQAPDIPVSPLADPQQGLLASGGVLCRNKTQPRRHVTCFAELAAVAYSSDERGRAERTDPWNREQPPHGLVTMRNRLDFFCQFGDPLLDMREIVQQIGE